MNLHEMMMIKRRNNVEEETNDDQWSTINEKDEEVDQQRKWWRRRRRTTTTRKTRKNKRKNSFSFALVVRIIWRRSFLLDFYWTEENSSVDFNRLTLLSLASFSLKEFENEFVGETFWDIVDVELDTIVEFKTVDVDVDVDVEEFVVNGFDVPLDIVDVEQVVEADVGVNLAVETNLLIKGNWTGEPDIVKICA